jgi:hypothetical protein
MSAPLTALARPAGTSLFAPDVPVPPGANALTMTADPPNWRYLEVYDNTALDPAASAAWLRAGLPPAGWEFERLEPADQGPALVFFQAGETILAEPGADRVTYSRRRTCADSLGRIPVGPPVDSRWLLEMPVVPGAIYEGWDPPVEQHRLTCADLGLLADWYREHMETGNWALAATELPSGLERTLLFVRPDELGLPHDQRSAWALVELSRLWPHQFQFRLSRDPTGVRDP